MGALPLRLFPFPGLRDCAFSPDRVRVAARGVDPVLSRIVTGRVLATFGNDRQNSASIGPARRPLVRFVSANQYWLTR